MPDILKMQAERAGLIKAARAILDKAEEEKRSANAEENGKYDELFNKAADLGKDIDRAKKLEAAELEMRTVDERRVPAQKTDAERRANKEEEKAKPPSLASEEYRKQFAEVLAGNRKPENIGEEYRALQSDNDSQAGYLVVPEEFATELLRDVDNAMLIRQLAKKHTVNKAASLGIRKVTARASTFAYSAELKVSTADSSLAFGKKILHPHHMTGRILLSRDLVRNSVEPIEALVRGELAYDAAETMEEKFMAGTGVNEPLGLFTASADGISTSRDVSTGNTITLLKADNLRECKYTLKPQHRRLAVWLFHRDTVKAISKMKDGDGQYLWKPGITESDPDMLLGLKVYESEYVPNTFTTGLYVGLLGNMRYYEIADALDMEIQSLWELHAETNQVGYIGRLKNDAMPTLEEAFVRVTIA